VATDTVFVGQQDGERILYEVLGTSTATLGQDCIKVVFLALLIVVLFGVMSSVNSLLILMGIVAGAGFWTWQVGGEPWSWSSKSKSFITDRRVVRFNATTPWTINQRSLSWDEVVKIKTKSPNALWRMLGAGSVVAHARSTVVPANSQNGEQTVTSDDIEMDYVIYYQDLGNYLDKVLYLFKNKKADIKPIAGCLYLSQRVRDTRLVIVDTYLKIGFDGGRSRNYLFL
jgi:hypothetical protein